jgi:hypothetical protein
MAGGLTIDPPKSLIILGSIITMLVHGEGFDFQMNLSGYRLKCARARKEETRVVRNCLTDEGPLGLQEQFQNHLLGGCSYGRERGGKGSTRRQAREDAKGTTAECRKVRDDVKTAGVLLRLARGETFTGGGHPAWRWPELAKGG